MQFEWDPAKAAASLKRHRVSFHEAAAAFTWEKLKGKRVLVDHGGQMDAAFRKGGGDYIHQQGPAPQQLEHDGVGHVVASVGEAIGPCAFSPTARRAPGSSPPRRPGSPRPRRRSSSQSTAPCDGGLVRSVL